MNSSQFIGLWVCYLGWLVISWVSGIVCAIYARTNYGSQYKHQENCKFFLWIGFVPIFNVIFGGFAFIFGIWCILHSIICLVAEGSNPLKTFGRKICE